MAQAMLDQANFSMIQSQSRMEQEQKDMETLLSTFTKSVVENQQNQNSSQDNKVVPKKMMRKRKDYSNTKVKTRNLLTNVSYRRFKQTDFNKNNFIVDIMPFLTQNFNPINLDRKLDSEKERDMVKLLWDECIPHEFVRYLYSAKNFELVSSPYLTYQKPNEMVSNYFLEDLKRINTAKYKIEEKFQLIHYVYSLLFSKIYSRTTILEFERKTILIFISQLGKVEKQLVLLAKKF